MELAAACALPDLWECRVHGPLPLSHFSRDDLSRRRHRCKRCLSAKMSSYRARNPLRHMWLRFVQRAREHFSCEAVDALCWLEHGQPLLSRLLALRGMQEDTPSLLQRYKLAWAPGPELDLQRVHLVEKDSRARKQRESPRVD